MKISDEFYEKLKAFSEEVDSYHKPLVDFHGEFKPANRNPEKDGYYITIRCGLGGIYQILDEFKDGNWQTGILDDSRVIAYSRDLVELKYDMNK